MGRRGRYFFSFYDAVAIGVTLPTIKEQFGVSTNAVSWAVTSGLIGYAFGAIAGSLYGDRYGRRRALLASSLAFSTGTLLSAASPDLTWLIISRFIAGLGLGAEIAGVATYIAEISPAPLRGRYSARATVLAFAGFSVVPVMARLLVPESPYGWRLLFLIGATGGLIVCYVRRKLPESARWLLAHHRLEAARAEVSAAESEALRRTGIPLPNVTTSRPEWLPEQHFAMASITKRHLRRRLALFTTMWFVYYIGNYSWLTLAPTLFVERGFSVESSLEFSAITGPGFLVGAIIAVALSDRFERRTLSIIIAAIWSCSLGLIGYIGSPGVILVFGFVASVTVGCLVSILYAYTAEQFPTVVRATCVAVSDGLGHTGGAVAPLILLPVNSALLFSGPFYVMAATGLGTAILLSCGRKTKHTTLH
ncbi:MFS transporter [Streptomyces sp. NPDC091376]|uniref:MFS transporter n=1 Tax=Streptomyces sp. NPDC091376 TaxID=3365994 RepID=UPI00382605EB